MQQCRLRTLCARLVNNNRIVFMIKKLLNFYKISSPLASGEVDSERSSRFKRIRLATFCRLPPDMAFTMFVVLV